MDTYTSPSLPASLDANTKAELLLIFSLLLQKPDFDNKKHVHFETFAAIGVFKVEILRGDFDAPRQNPNLAAACAGCTWICGSMPEDGVDRQTSTSWRVQSNP